MAAKKLLSRPTEAPPAQEPGHVVAVTGRTARVRTARGEVTARRATSCLLAPEPGDLVLLASAGDAGVYLLAVLEREEGAAARLVFDGDASLVTPRGRVSIAAQEGIALATCGEAVVTAARLTVRAEAGEVAVERLGVVGEAVQADVARVAVTGEACETRFERRTERVARAYRFVAETDQLRAGRIDQAAREDVSVHGRHVVMTADELVKIDSEQVHLG